MGPLEIGVILLIVAIFMFAVIISVALKFVPKQQPNEPEPLADEEPSERPYPYQVREYLLTRAEQNFCNVLSQILRNPTNPAGTPQLLIAPKVRVADVLQTRGGQDAGGNWRKYLNKIDRKHFDFVLTYPGTWKFACAIELDDSSHNTQKRRERDEFLDAACEDARLPLLRVRVAREYDPQDIAERVKERVTKSS